MSNQTPPQKNGKLTATFFMLLSVFIPFVFNYPMSGMSGLLFGQTNMRLLALFVIMLIGLGLVMYLTYDAFRKNNSNTAKFITFFLCGYIASGLIITSITVAHIGLFAQEMKRVRAGSATLVYSDFNPNAFHIEKLCGLTNKEKKQVSLPFYKLSNNSLMALCPVVKDKPSTYLYRTQKVTSNELKQLLSLF